MKTKTFKVQTWLPLFPGFYNTRYELDVESVLDEYKEEENNQEKIENGYDKDAEIEYNDLEIDNGAYEAEVAKTFTKFVAKKLKKYIKSITMQTVSSPREYNFINDSINIKVEINLEAIQKLFKDEAVLQPYSTFLKACYTSYDGFISSHSNNVETWLQDIKDLPNTQEIEHKMGSILEFILEYEEELSTKDEDLEIYYAISESIYPTEFCSLKVKEK